MKAHQRTDRLILITILLVLLVAIVMLTYKAPTLTYEITPEETLKALTEQEYMVSVEEVANLKNTNTTFVDIRNSDKYFVNHIEGAINIPLIKLLDKDNLETFGDDSKNFILYGENHRMANGPWMVLKQLGYDNIKILIGGYTNFMNIGSEYPVYYASFQDLEKAEFDLLGEINNASDKFSKIDEEIGGGAVQQTAVTVKRKVSAPAPVIPQEEEEEEDEGC